MTDQRGTLKILFVIVALALLWEILITILGIPGDSELLIGLLALLLQVTFASLVGGVLGVTLGIFIAQNVWLTHATLCFLRIGLWIPFLVSWAVHLVWIVSVAAVTASTFYHYLTARFLLRLDWQEARPWVMRATILQALFISLLSQLWDQHGFIWFFVGDPEGVARGIVTLSLLVSALFFANRTFRSDFDRSASLRATILLQELSIRNWRSLWGVLLLTAICLVSWQLLGMLGLYPLVSTPLDGLKTAYHLLITGIDIPPLNKPIWGDISVSLVELFVGLIIAGGTALIICRGLSVLAYIALRNWVSSFLPLTYIAPIVISPFLLEWGIVIGSWQTMLGVALLSFFPFIQVLWGLHDRPLPCRILLALDESLPYAFVAMLFGETMNAVAGLGFFMVVAPHYTRQPTEGFATFLITLALLIIFSSIIRWIIKWQYFPAPLYREDP